MRLLQAVHREGPERLPQLRPPAGAARPLTRLLRILPLALVALAVGCGSDEEPAATTTATTPTHAETTPVTVEAPPETAPATVTTPPQTATTAPPDEDDGGGVPAPPADTAPAQTAPEPEPESEPDSPTNDTPPPPGSPAERFEQECAKNPQACG